MKNMKNLLLVAIAIFGFSAVSFGQSTSGAATATATLVSPLTVTKTADMNFGTLASSNTDGTAVLTTAGGVTSTGGVQVISGGATTTAAKFSVDAPANTLIKYTLPLLPIVLLNGTQEISIISFVATPTSPSNSGTGEYDIELGATLEIPAGTAAGTYTNTTALKVTVDYE